MIGPGEVSRSKSGIIRVLNVPSWIETAVCLLQISSFQWELRFDARVPT